MAVGAFPNDVIIAGGTESLSTAPYYLRNARYGYSIGNGILLDPNTESQFNSQPPELYGQFNMGMTAENLVEKYNISRKQQDEFALRSQQLALKAIAAGTFKQEIIPYKLKTKKSTTVIDTDEHPRETTLEKLGKLPPVFKEGGSVTAGSSSGRNDGASVVLLMSGDKLQEYI